jgi:hypothetical protein
MQNKQDTQIINGRTFEALPKIARARLCASTDFVEAGVQAQERTHLEARTRKYSQILKVPSLRNPCSSPLPALRALVSARSNSKRHVIPQNVIAISRRSIIYSNKPLVVIVRYGHLVLAAETPKTGCAGWRAPAVLGCQP